MAQAIPNYSISCFKITLSLYSKLGSLLAKFWWGNQRDAKKIHWVRKQVPGGMGFSRGGLGVVI